MVVGTSDGRGGARGDQACGCMAIAGLHSYLAAGWCMFYYRHNFVNFLDWPLIFSTDCREP
jgi:hypothetical protein